MHITLRLDSSNEPQKEFAKPTKIQQDKVKAKSKAKGSNQEQMKAATMQEKDREVIELFFEEKE